MFENLSKKIGDFAQNAAKKSGEFAQTAAKKSSEVVEITKLNMSITGEENSIEKLYVEIGKLYYSSNQAGTELDGSIAKSDRSHVVL